MSKYIWDRQKRKFVVPQAYMPPVILMPAPMIMRPLSERVSPVDGSVITDRGQLREHNKRNNVVDVGNEILERNTPKTSKREYRDTVGEAYRKVASGYAPRAEEAGTLEGEKVETKIIGGA